MVADAVKVFTKTASVLHRCHRSVIFTKIVKKGRNDKQPSECILIWIWFLKLVFLRKVHITKKSIANCSTKKVKTINIKHIRSDVKDVLYSNTLHADHYVQYWSDDFFISISAVQTDSEVVMFFFFPNIDPFTLFINYSNHSLVFSGLIKVIKEKKTVIFISYCQCETEGHIPNFPFSCHTQPLLEKVKYNLAVLSKYDIIMTGRSNSPRRRTGCPGRVLSPWGNLPDPGSCPPPPDL